MFGLCSLAIHCQSFSYVSFTALQTSIVKTYRITVLAAVALNLSCFKSEITEQSNEMVLDASGCFDVHSDINNHAVFFYFIFTGFISLFFRFSD